MPTRRSQKRILNTLTNFFKIFFLPMPFVPHIEAGNYFIFDLLDVGFQWVHLFDIHRCPPYRLPIPHGCGKAASGDEGQAT